MQKKILIATGIYPPDIGGPAEYAAALERVWKGEGHKVAVKYFSFEKKLPTGIRHIFFMIKSIPAVLSADYIIVLDTWSAAIPTAILCKVLGKKFSIRTGGDFLWESYVERTKKKILFKDFYKTEIANFNSKEQFIFQKTKWLLKRAGKIVFSTSWQRDIWTKPYGIDISKTKIVENYYGEKNSSISSKRKVFVGSTRALILKNLDTLKEVFEDPAIKDAGISLDLAVAPHDKFIEKIKNSYAVILVSLGDISPNMILDAMRCNKPFIVTKETGIYERIKDIAIFADPLDEKDIKEKVLWLSNDENYKSQQEKIANFAFRHSWAEIADELLNIK